MKSAWKLLDAMWRNGEGMIRRHHYFSSQPGCKYAKIASRKFVEEGEYAAVKEQFLELLDRFREIEGEDFGR